MCRMSGLGCHKPLYEGEALGSGLGDRQIEN